MEQCCDFISCDNDIHPRSLGHPTPRMHRVPAAYFINKKIASRETSGKSFTTFWIISRSYAADQSLSRSTRLVHALIHSIIFLGLGLVTSQHYREYVLARGKGGGLCAYTLTHIHIQGNIPSHTPIIPHTLLRVGFQQQLLKVLDTLNSIKNFLNVRHSACFQFRKNLCQFHWSSWHSRIKETFPSAPPQGQEETDHEHASYQMSIVTDFKSSRIGQMCGYHIAKKPMDILSSFTW